MKGVVWMDMEGKKCILSICMVTIGFLFPLLSQPSPLKFKYFFLLIMIEGKINLKEQIPDKRN